MAPPNNHPGTALPIVITPLRPSINFAVNYGNLLNRLNRLSF